MTAFDVAVIGRGIMGLCALNAFIGGDERVVSFEREAPGHDRGSSHGESRVIRTVNFEGGHLDDLVRDAIERWKTLEGEPQSLYVPNKVLQAGVRDSELVAGAETAALARGVDVRTTHEAVKNAWPLIDLPRDWEAQMQDGGYIRAAAAMDTLQHRIRDAGNIEEISASVRGLTQKGDRVEVVTSAGVYQARKVIVTTGPWISELVPEVADHIHLSRQVLVWFEPGDERLRSHDAIPTFVFSTRTTGIEGKVEDQIVYGFPYLEGYGLKAALHVVGDPLAKPEDAARDVSESEVQAVADAIEALIPGAVGRVRSYATCIYTNTTDSDFIIDYQPGCDRVVFASACSGHGFKFGPAVGALLARMVREGVKSPKEFRLDRPTLRKRGP